MEYTTQVSIFGCITSPICLFLIGFSSKVLPLTMQKATPLVPALQSNWLLLHVSMMMVSYSLLILGSLLSIVFLFINRKKENDVVLGLDFLLYFSILN